MGSFDRLEETLASIHLNSQNMEEMDVEQVVEIPDTPDRRHGSLRHLDEDGRSTAYDCRRNFEFRSNGSLDRFRSTGTLRSERCPNTKKYLLAQEDPTKVEEFKTRNRIDASVSFERNFPSSCPPLFRRTVNNLKSEAGRSSIAEHKDKGKSVYIEASDKPPVCTGDGDKSDISEEEMFEMAFRSRALKSSLVVGTKDDRKLSSAGGCGASKGKANADSRSYTGLCLQGNGEKRMNLGAGHILKLGGEIPAANMSFKSPRVNGNKRLVRNGCISPNNIALGPQRSVDAREMSFCGAVRDASMHMMDVSDIVPGNAKSNSAKGKGVPILPLESKTYDARRNLFLSSDSSRGTNIIVGGWRSTGGHRRAEQQPISVKDGDLQRKQYDTEIFSNKNFDDSGTITRDACDTGTMNDSQSAYGPTYEDIPINERNLLHNKRNLLHNKRNMMNAKRKRGQCAMDQAQSSASALYGDSEVLYLGSSKGLSSSGSSRIHNNGRMSILCPISEVDEHSIEARNTHSEGEDLFDNVDPDVIARQMEEDERLARQMEEDERLAQELQEQLYNEVPESARFEIDEDLLWVLQEEDDVFPTASSPTQPFVRRRTLPTSRWRQSPSIRNTSTRRASQAVGPSRSSLSRTHVSTRSTTASPRNRHYFTGSLSGVEDIQFPPSMDLEMRLDILEALEARVGDSNDLRRASNASRTMARILQTNREFNENDYEMLSTLDECNLPNPGLTSRQISNLPESTVQADNFDDTCAICLETPTKGETIKHLPCLHKFHKDCIDVWLNRKKLCPICKSSIC